MFFTIDRNIKKKRFYFAFFVFVYEHLKWNRLIKDRSNMKANRIYYEKKKKFG